MKKRIQKYEPSLIQLIEGYSKCSCGAITLYGRNGKSLSCKESALPDYISKEIVYAINLEIPIENVVEYKSTVFCDHCVNHYGIDLCACGSGEHYSKCKNESDVCGRSMQSLIDLLTPMPNGWYNMEGLKK